jgi:hypothetical protein
VLGRKHLWCSGEQIEEEQRDSGSGGGTLAFVQLVAGGFIGHTCARLGSGSGYCWGENEVGQVGDGTTTDRWTPVAVSGGLVFGDIDAGFRHSCGFANTTVYCWGPMAPASLATTPTAKAVCRKKSSGNHEEPEACHEHASGVVIVTIGTGRASRVG